MGLVGPRGGGGWPFRVRTGQRLASATAFAITNSPLERLCRVERRHRSVFIDRAGLDFQPLRAVLHVIPRRQFGIE
jgi:hypothetical protein